MMIDHDDHDHDDDDDDDAGGGGSGGGGHMTCFLLDTVDSNPILHHFNFVQLDFCHQTVCLHETHQNLSCNQSRSWHTTEAVAIRLPVSLLTGVQPFLILVLVLIFVGSNSYIWQLCVSNQLPTKNSIWTANNSKIPSQRYECFLK